MIPVTPQPEPSDFATKVKSRGNAFLASLGGRKPTKEEFRQHAYWKACLDQLSEAYGHICAYSCVWVPGHSSVDHYRPKSGPDFGLAYDWSNYRLADDKINSFKGDSTAVLDPFTIQPGWFELDFASFHVQPNPNIPRPIQTGVSDSVRILRLNDDPYVKQRFKVVQEYSRDEFPMVALERYYPFIAHELKRQGKTDSIKGTM